MELVEDKHNSKFQISSYIDNSIKIADKVYNFPIVFHNKSIKKFNINNPKSIHINNIEKILEGIDIILIGTGKVNQILNEELIYQVSQTKKGLEFMNTESACKTHNLLLSESRSFASILYP